MILFRHCDRRFPFLWESSAQPGARWHAEGEGPVQYFADTPSGAWAEFLRHEGVREEKDLGGIRRALWAVEVRVEALDVREPALGVRSAAWRDSRLRQVSVRSSTPSRCRGSGDPRSFGGAQAKALLRLLLERLPQYPLDPRVLKGLPVAARTTKPRVSRNI